MDRKSRTPRTAKHRTRILLVDDHPLVRERLTEIINREADLTVCGEAEDRLGAMLTIPAKRPGLVIIDLTLKNSDGLELIKDIRSRWPKLRMLVVSMHDESLYAERVIRAGALGYITKQEATRNILVAIRRVLEGTIYLNEKIASHIISRLTAHAGAVAATPAELLSDRELQVFDLTGQGLNNGEIADRLHIAVKTIETYRARIREKLMLKHASELLQSAIAWAHQHGTA
jgi:DNA-binding NarL/FixJ family response regulator